MRLKHDTWEIMQGDVLERLADLPDNSVHCVCTSPPYFGLRDYGTAEWEGGSAECDHKGPAKPTQAGFNERYFGKPSAESDKQGELTVPYRSTCGKCGAVRIDKQIGLEPTPAAFVDAMVRVFREVRRVLRPDGTAWVNLGDSYAQTSKRGNPEDYEVLQERADRQGYNVGAWGAGTKRSQGIAGRAANTAVGGLKPKDLMMMPARVAIALCDDGWWLRSDIIWCKRAPMPESVTDRPTTAHEHIFLLTKSARYFYDADAVREAHTAIDHRGANRVQYDIKAVGQSHAPSKNAGYLGQYEAGRNAWSYWLLSPEPTPEAHFATYPTEIPRRAILAGTSAHGCCAECGAPWRRVVGKIEGPIDAFRNSGRYVGQGAAVSNDNHDGGRPRGMVNGPTVGWQPTCAHNAPIVPATVLDPFSGAGTTVKVALRLQRRGIGIELNPEYVAMSERIIRNDAPLFNSMEVVA